MTPKDNRRSKENMASMNPQAFWEMIRSGFHYQYMYNALQLNRGQVHPDSLPKFSNIARLGGMASTDWSWAPLFADLDNDGWKDLFITNGIKREVNNRDFHNAMKMKINFTQSLDSINYEDIPSEPIANYVFQNTSAAEELGFEDRSEEWKLNTKGFSHGCAFADLDNDGDLDLVVNNMDAEAGIYENELSDNNFLRIKLKGSAGNRFGIGAKVKIIASGQVQTQHLSLTRGYQSAVEPVLHFGLGKSEIVDEINIDWLDGKTAKLQNISSNQTLVLDYEKAEKSSEDPVINSSLFTRTSLSNEIIQHHENDYDDYALEPLLPYETSHLGGHLSVGDANGDGLEDFFLGNSFTHSSVLYLQTKEGQFKAQTTPFEADKNFEDMGSLFFDADQDGDLDLYVVSGGNEFSKRPDLLQDRLYINDNNQGFIRSQTALPKIIGSGGRVSAGDYDQDGDLDLFIGGRLSPANYPKPGISYLLENKGGKDLNLKFEDVTTKIAPELQEIGMVTDALWSDYDNDNDLDLIVVGEWMPITIFDNGNGQFNKSTVQQLNSASGWWYSLAQGDFDQDGDIDYIAGNLGTNYKYQASPDAPFDVYADDFDQNGRQDIVLGYYQDGEQFPLRGRQCSSEQIPTIALKFKDYHSFATSDLADIYGTKNLENAYHLQATTFESVYIKNKGDGEFEVHPLPTLAQISNINDLLVDDFDEDGYLDIILAGNLHDAEIETPRNDASLGLFLKGDGKGNFEAVDMAESGLYLPGNVRDLSVIRVGEGQQRGILVGVNEGRVQFILKNTEGTAF
ncbi:MAG: FG-GAP-like repeat-containing protein, partial [Bacteroidota bacterium]